MDIKKLTLFTRMSVACVAYSCLQLKEKELICLVEECLVLAIFLEDVIVQNRCYILLAPLYTEMHQIKKAIECYENILHMAIEMGNKLIIFKACKNLGYFNYLLGNIEEAAKYHEKTLHAAKEIGFKKEEATAYLEIGNDHQFFGKYLEAIQSHTSCLAIAKEIGDKTLEGKAYGNLGDAYESLGKYQDAAKFQERALQIAIETSNKLLESAAYGNLGNIYRFLGNYQKAIEYQEKSLDVKKVIGCKREEGVTYLNLGTVYQAIGKYQKATEYYNNCLRIALELEDKELEEGAYGNLGNICKLQGKYQESVKYHEMFLKIAVEIGDRKNEGKAYGNLGIAYQRLGKFNEAKEFYEKKLSIAVDMEDRIGQGHVFINLGVLHGLMGKYLKAIEYLEKSLEIAKENNEKEAEATAYANLANNYSALGRYHVAKQYCEKSLSITQEIGHKAREGDAYQSLGYIYSAFGEYQKAIEHHKKCLTIAVGIGNRSGEGTAYGNIASNYYLLGDHQKASECYEKMLDIAKEVGDRRGEGLAYMGIGTECYSLGKYDEAIEHSKKCLSISVETEDRNGQGCAHYQIGASYQRLVKQHDSVDQSTSLGKSESHLKKSIQSFESLFDDLEENDQHKISIVDRFIHAYKKLANVYVQTQHTDEALLISDRGRARALGDLLTLKYSTKNKMTSKCGSIQFTDIERILSTSNQFDILFYAVGDDSAANIWVLSYQRSIHFYPSTVKGFESSTEHSSLFKNNSPEEHDEESILKLVKDTYDKMNVREGMSCEDRSLGLPEVEDQGVPKDFVPSHVTEHNTAETVKIVKEDNKMDTRCIYDVDDDDKPLDFLYDSLIAPVQDKLHQEEIVIIPDGALFMLPFAAFHDLKTGQFLSETKRIRLAPSLTTLKVLQESSDDQHYKSGALIVGNPEIGNVKYEGIERSFSNLPGAEEEAIAIAQQLGVEPLTRRQATKEVVIKKLQVGVSVIHFAAHGSGNGQILLAPSGTSAPNRIPGEQDFVLTTKEAQESGIRAQLVVLSCCHSGRGEIKSEGVVGMSRAFLAAGARAVVASLWAIDDSATKEFMLKFYSHLKRGDSASKSLQQTMKEMRETENYWEPRYWAGFFLIGDDVTISV